MMPTHISPIASDAEAAAEAMIPANGLRYNRDDVSRVQ